MKNFFLKHFLRLQSAIHLLIIESTTVKIFRKEKAAIFEAVFSKSVLIEQKKPPRNEETSEEVYLHTLLRHFKPEIANLCARNP